jgi:general secretion pathway protein A
MYKQFYGLKQNPFELSPDPYFFYPTPRHTEALAHLVYGVVHRKGFVVVTGEVGTGKTLLVRCLLESLKNSRIAFAYVNNPLIPVPEFFSFVVNDLGLNLPRGSSKTESLLCLNSFLINRSREDLTTALVVDEAQLLSHELLEEIRLLTNLETTKHKLLQIVLLGQPEFEQKLDSADLRQLKQRIGLRCNLKPLELQELRGYIHERLWLAGAGAKAANIFPEETIELIYKCSSGIPRLVNTLCENSLLLGFWHNQPQISWEIVLEAAADLRLTLFSEITSASDSNSKSLPGVNFK